MDQVKFVENSFYKIWGALFLFNFFQGLSFLHLEITLHFAKIVLCIWRKIIFFCHRNFMIKIILSCLKMNLKLR